MKKLLFTILLIAIPFIAQCEEFQEPFTCYPKLVQEVCAKHGFKLDIDPADRQPDSWGYIKSAGSWFSIFSYRSTSQEELKRLLTATNEYDALVVKMEEQSRILAICDISNDFIPDKCFEKGYPLEVK